jgi:hypothetical protein
MLAHSVYFSLSDNTPAAKKQLVAACKEHLSGHPGTVFFAAGTLAEDIEWPISDRDFDVVLQLVFQDKAAHDRYQDSPRHAQFLEENANNCREIRVFDAYVEQV